MDCLYIIIPAYNEEENIRDVVKAWYPVIEKHNGGGKSRMVVIDDGSKDSTYAILSGLVKKYSMLTVLTKPNSGHGATLLYGYQYAIQQKADYIFQTDSDGQTLPEEFEQFWEQRQGYDMVIGHRNKREDGIFRVFVTKVLKGVIRACFGVTVTDANTPFRLMKGDTLQRYMGYIPENYNLSNVLISVIYVKKGCRVKYIPITFRPRQGGVNSINFKKIVKIGSLDPAGRVYPVNDGRSVYPNVKKSTLLAFLIGCMIPAGLLVLLVLLENTYKTDTELKNDLDLPVLGVIPSLDCVEDKRTAGSKRKRVR